MKKNVKTIQVLAVFVVMAFLFLPLTLSGQGKPNFSGSWTLNAAKSNMGDAGQGGRMMGGGGPMTIKQDGNTMTVDQQFTRDGETTTRTSKYTLDGKESVNSTGRGESKSTASWAADGKSLTIKTTRSFNSNTFTTTEVWTLTAPNTLTVQATSPGRDGGERKTTRVYDKK